MQMEVKRTMIQLFSTFSPKILKRKYYSILVIIIVIKSDSSKTLLTLKKKSFFKKREKCNFTNSNYFLLIDLI